MSAPSPCSASSATAERIYEGSIDDVVVTRDALVVARFNAFDGSVTFVSKDTCAATEVVSAGGERGLESPS